MTFALTPLDALANFIAVHPRRTGAGDSANPGVRYYRDISGRQKDHQPDHATALKLTAFWDDTVSAVRRRLSAASGVAAH
jgi:hypothetical protein